MLKPVAGLILVAFTSVYGANSLTPEEIREGFKLLFDGKSLNQWQMMKWKPDHSDWLVRDGALTWERGLGSWLRSDETYEDFVLRLEYRTGGDSNSGIFLRSSERDKAVLRMELQILDDHGKPPGIHSTGSLYSSVAPAKNMAKPPGEWNTVEASVIGRQIVVIWNGEKIHDVNLDDPRISKPEGYPLAARPRFGYIGLQAYVKISPVAFRNIRIKVLKPGPKNSVP
jgi:hypothetical protein